MSEDNSKKRKNRKRYPSFRRLIRDDIEKSLFADQVRSQGSASSLWHNIPAANADDIGLVMSGPSDSPSDVHTASEPFDVANGTLMVKTHVPVPLPEMKNESKGKDARLVPGTGLRSNLSENCWRLMESESLEYTGLSKCRFEYHPRDGEASLSAPVEFAAPTGAGALHPRTACENLFLELYPDRRICL